MRIFNIFNYESQKVVLQFRVLFFQRTRVWFITHTWWLLTICNANSRVSDSLLGFCEDWMHVVHIHVCRQNIHRHKHEEWRSGHDFLWMIIWREVKWENRMSISTGTCAACQWQCSQREWLSHLKQPMTLLIGVGPQGPCLHLCWNFDWLDLVQVTIATMN